MSLTFFSLGNRALREGKYAEAIIHYENALEQSPWIEKNIIYNLSMAERKANSDKQYDGITLSSDSLEDLSQIKFKNSFIDIVVPVFNALEDVKLCLDSIIRHTDGFSVQIIIVNDGSDFETTQWLRQNLLNNPIITLIENVQNFGYTRSINIGLKASSAEYVITQNSDTIVSKGWLLGMVRCMESDSMIGVVGPLSNAASWQNVPSLYNQYGEFAVNEIPMGLSIENFAHLVANASKFSYPRVPFVNGFCFMISRLVIDSIGYMDEVNFPLGYGEENDYCIRASDAGFVLAIADNVFVFHAKSKSFGHDKRKILSQQGNINLKRKHTLEKFIAQVEIIKRTEQLDKVRINILKLLNKNKLNLLRTSAVEVRLKPDAAFGSKNYVLTPELTSHVINQPFTDPIDTLEISNIDLGLHLHIYYLDLLDEFIFWFKNIPIPFFLYVSVPDISDCDSVIERLKEKLPLAKIDVRSFPNRGRDIGPLLAGFGSSLKQHEFIGHVHSKRSPHNTAKRDWRTQLMTHLMGTKGVATANLRLLNENTHIGMIFPEYHWSLKNQIEWGTNYPLCHVLSDMMKINIKHDQMIPFPAGSMFLARTDALIPLLNLNLKFEDFPIESNQVDGTIAHAIERLFGNVVNANKMTIQQVRCEKAHDLLYYFTALNPYTPPANSAFSQMVANYHNERLTNEKPTVGLLTANAGGYDPVIIHETLDPEIDYIYMSDNKINDYGFLQVEPLICVKGSETMAARRAKLTANYHLRNYDVGIWMDANVLIRRSLKPYLNLVRQYPKIPIFGIPHPKRSCIYEEAKAVINLGKADANKVESQINYYAEEGFPRKYGLIETNFLLFNLKHPLISKIFELWLNELETQTHRDQLSLNYVLWKLDAQWFPLMAEGHSLRDSNDFAYFGHGQNSGYLTPKLSQVNSIHA